MNMPQIALHGLPKRLVDDQLIAATVIEEASASAKTKKISLVQYLCDKQLLSSHQIGESAAKEFGIPLYALDKHNPDYFPQDIVDSKLLKKHQAIPLMVRGQRLFLAIADPTNQHAITEIQFQTGVAVEPVLALYSDISEALEKWQEGTSDSDIGQALGTMDDVHLDDLDMEAVDENADSPEGADNNGDDDAPIVRFVNKMLLDAIRLGASDIHFEPYEKSYRVRFRVDGILQEMSRPPANLAPRLAARFKVMSRMDISERRVPQDGRVKLKRSKNKAIDCRVNTLPLQFGEKIVLRILDPSSAKMGIEALGYEDDQKQLYMDALARPQGMILVTGPTGSGKTVSLYTGLNILNTTERNISTAEDPIEINMEGINQTQINMRVGLSFAEALRSFLRQDPDVILIGEIRDGETAEIATQASLTGHLVLSTLHTNTAAGAITRLQDLGVVSFLLASTVRGIVSQRLLRKLCTGCRVAEQPNDFNRNLLKLQPGAETFHSSGCTECNNTGFKGRQALFELVSVDANLQTLIHENAGELELENAIRKTVPSIRDAGFELVRRGVTTIEEVLRVTSV